MTTKQIAIRLLIGLATSITASSPANSATGPWAVDANLGVASDYRWRGISLSDRKPVVQAGVDVSHSSGAYIGLWGSSLPKSSGRAEIDLSAGWSFERSATSGSIGMLVYLYPSLDDADYFEIVGSGTRDFGPFDLSVGASYAPKQKNLARPDVYVTSDMTVKLGAGVSAKAHLGMNRGPFTETRTRLDWSVGVAKSWRGHELSISYSGIHRPSKGAATEAPKGGVTMGLLTSF